jgi:RNA polymerase sigma-70 factor, ECF subfamily
VEIRPGRKAKLKLAAHQLAHTAELELVARARARADAGAYGELVRRHQSQVRLFLLRLCRDPATADDLAQDCFVHGWEKLAGYRGDGAFGGWLMRIAWTTFLQSKRRGDRYREVVQQAAREDVGAASVDADEESGDLDKLLAVLSEDERAVMILAYGFGMSHREISETTDTPVGTVKSIIHRSKQRIRHNFEIEHHQSG